MPYSTFRKNRIRTALLLELNSCFARVSKHYAEYGDDDDREFLKTLIASITECVEGEAEPEKAATKQVKDTSPTKG